MKVFSTNFGLQTCLWQHLIDFTVPQVSYHSLDQAELPSQHSNISLPQYASNVAYNGSGLNRLELSIPMFRGFNSIFRSCGGKASVSPVFKDSLRDTIVAIEVEATLMRNVQLLVTVTGNGVSKLKSLACTYVV
jgi:hypothetical protein